MKIECNDNAATVIGFICAVIVCSQLIGCWRAKDAQDAETVKAHIAAGECLGNWGGWAKCH